MILLCFIQTGGRFSVLVFSF